MNILFVETAVFTSRIARLGLEQELRNLQKELLANPHAGRLDPGTGGLRKVRMASGARAKGKRGGVRVHYLYLSHLSRIYLMFLYAKDETDTLAQDQKEQLSKVVKAIKREL